MVALVPLFLIIIFLEYAYARKKGLDVYYPYESVGHFLTGVGQLVFNPFWFICISFVYVAVYQRFALNEWDEKSWVTAIVLLTLSDLCWYWGHRASHRINFFAASHFIHHQAEDFNHASAMRQSWTSRPMMFLFFLPLAVSGFSGEAVLVSLVISTFIQFLSHNGVLRRRLGPLEWIFVTPVSHRVHHGLNAPYLDKNYGGIFIFWDKLFGTYAENRDPEIPIQLKTPDPINHYDAFESNWNYYKRLAFATRRLSWRDGLKLWVGPPEELDRVLRANGYRESAPRPPLRPLTARKAGQMALVTLPMLGLLVWLLLRWPEATLTFRFTLALTILALIHVAGKVITHSADRART